MKKTFRSNLLLEQLEDRIFLDANPVAGALDVPVDGVPDSADSMAAVDTTGPAVPAHDPAAGQDQSPDTTAAAPAVTDTPSAAAGSDGQTTVDGQDQSPDPEAAPGTDQADMEQQQAGTTADTPQQAPDPAEPAADTDPTRPIDPMIGEDFDFTVSFDNTTGSTVYGPYIDMVLDGGQDGSDVPVDGITFQNATYLGVGVESMVIDITSDGQTIDHPWATDTNGDPLQITGINGHSFRAGDQFVSLRLPFGSFEPDQPAAEISVSAHMSENADVGPGTDLAVEVTTGAMYGHDPLDNPGTDAPLRGSGDGLVQASLAFTPEVITYNADIEVPGVRPDCQVQHSGDHDLVHQEIPTGPNFPGTYVIRVGVADGQTVSNLVLSEQLPDNIVFLGNVRVTDSGGNPLAAQTGQNGSDLQISLDDPVTGSANPTDVFIRYDFYVPEQTAAGQSVIDPATGDVTHIINNGRVAYTWNPVDPNDPGPVNGVIDAEVDSDGNFSPYPDLDDITHAQSIALQKDHVLSSDTGASGYSPDDTVSYTLDFQISDYFSFGDHDAGDSDYSFRIDDLVPDGLTMANDNNGHYLAGIDIWQGGTLYHMDLTSSTTPGDLMWVTTDGANNLEVHYNLQAITAALNIDSGGILHGDLTDGSQDGPTHGRISYTADIARVFHDEDNTGNGGSDNYVDQGDILAGDALITGEIFAGGAFNGESESDGSCDGLQIVTGRVDKDIYAINGVTNPGDTPHISPGDTVTYRLHYEMPLSSTEDFHLVDYLPLPVFDVNDPDQDGTASGWTQVADGSLPAAGEWAFTNDDTYHTLNTTLDSVGAGSGNTLVFDWAPYHDTTGTASTVEILFTVTVSGEPFADGMYLTNQVRATEQGTPLADNTTDAIVQVVLDQPELSIVKGVVETDRSDGIFLGNSSVHTYFSEPGSSGFRSDIGTISSDWLAGHNINTDLRNIDAGDLVTFAIVVENSGHSGAFDIQISDTMPNGFATPSGGLNLSVTDGAGNALTYSGDLFSSLEITDDGDGALDATSPDSGANVLVITYDLVATSAVAAFQNLDNTATLTNYAGTEGGTDHTVTDPADTARVSIRGVTVDKAIVNTNQAHTSGDNIAIGEQVQYAVTFSVPEGTLYSAQLVDAMTDNASGPQMAVLSLDSITASAGLSAANGTFDDILANATIDADGGGFRLDFGDLTNSDTDNSVTETITVTFTGVVLNNPDLDRGETLNDTASISWVDGNNATHSKPDQGPDLTVVEPSLQVDKSVDAPHPDQDDTITFTLVVHHGTGSDSDAFDATLTDQIPAGLTYVAGSLTHSGGLAPDSLTINGSTISAAWATFAQGATSTITFQAHLDTAQAGQDLSNTADIDWTGLPGDVTTPQSTHSTLSTERTGDTADPGGAANDYRATDTAAVTVIGTIDKLDPTPSSYTIGETVVYDIQVDLPEGNTSSLVVTDALPDGMSYVSSQVVPGSFNGSDITSPTVVSTAGDGNDITFDFGDVTVTADNDTTNNGFTIQVTVLVQDVAGNHQGTDLTNHASMTYEDPANPGSSLSSSDPTDPTVSVVEPQITTHKSVTDSTDPGSDASPGEVLTYTTRFENTGHSTAFEVHATDDLPAGVVFNTGSATAVDQDGATVPVTITDDGSGNLTIAGDWDIDVGDWVQVQYTVTVMSAGFTAGSHTNTVDADWSSLDGSQTGERLYTDSGNSPVDGDQDTATAAFTVVTNGSIGDTVFFDADNSGSFTTGDVGISGVNVIISADVDSDGTPEYTATTTTDADGHYLFDDLAAFDNYTIRVDFDGSAGSAFNLQTAGYSQTYDLDENSRPILDHTASGISLAANQDRVDVDFGYAGQNTVGDVVWWDANGDGTQDTNEGGLNGLTVTLHADIDGDGNYEYSASTTTATHNGVDGWYSFGDVLPAGDYYVEVTPPAGSEPTYDIDHDTTGTSANRGNFTLGTDDDRDDIDFGYRGTGSLGDFVWFDADADANQDDGADSGLANVTLSLSADFDGDGNADYTTSTTTANDGSYSFGHLLGGTYTITVDTATLPVSAANWNQTYDEDGLGTANTATHTLAAGNTDDTVDFGYTGTGSLGDTVWYDANGNGVQEAGEPGLANVTVTISADVDGDGVDEYTNTAVTDGNGNYLFNHLPAADYTVSVTSGLPDGATPTYDLDSATSNPDSTTLYTLNQGEDTDRVDFGYTGSGSIGDTVWNDMDGDGVQDAGENGLSGVTVTLTGDLDHDGQADDTITTTTDANGHYSFDNLFLGAYTVAVDPATLPAGTSQTHDLDDPQTTTPNTPNSASVTLDAANPVNNDVDFGYNSKGTIGDTIWYDADSDGIQDPGELGLAGVTVTLTGDTDGDGNPDTVVVTTDANGHYLFDQLTGGDYTITVSNLPPGMTQTADPDGVRDNTTSLTLAGGETNLDQDFGYTGTGSIGDTIWNDANGNGTQDGGESGLAGVTVTLQADLNNDGIIDTVTTTTDSSGNYHFDNLPADTYTIIVDPTTLPPGMQQTADPDGTNDNQTSVQLGNGQPMDNPDADFGYRQTGTIGDTIWYDADGDGIQDPGELGLNGVTVTLTDAQGNTVATVTTGSDGQYLFDNLSAGDYTITLTDLPNGMQQTADPDGTNDNSANVTIGGSSPLVNLDQDFGYTGTGSIGDTIWNDANGDGMQNNGETGLAGVTVTLSGDFNGDGTPDTVTVTTDSNGHYHFDRLPEGQYTITVDPATLPPGMQQTADPDGGNDNTAAVTLAAGATNNDQDFGYRQSGSIGDTIWFDADGDGVQDPGELGLANVQVTLVGDLDGDGQADDTLTTVTDADGNYLFDRLPAGDYSITVDPATLPGGMEETFDFDGTGSPNTAQVTIGAHEANLDVDFGYKGTGSIGDTIWFDADNDGVQDPDEVGIPGVAVTITGDFDNDGQADDTMTVTTGPDGTYIFPNLPAGGYDITIDPTTLPGGMIPSGDPDGTPDNTTHLTLTAGENNLAQDFGYTGTGSIGDRIWNDANGNGIQDAGEPGLAGVQVCIGVDLDGDGQPDVRMSTTTDADGAYLFDNLPAGSHTVCVDPATLPPGMRPSFDPDGTGDNTTVVTLGAGEQNRSTDFGYTSPAPPPDVTPVIPAPPVPPAPEPALPAADGLLMYQQFVQPPEQETLFTPFTETPWPEPLVPISPVYTGHSEPGTTLFLTLFDFQGNAVGYETVMADTAGNWLASFPGALLYDIPHHMEIEQTISSYNESSAGLYNLRTYFNPNFSAMVFSTTPLTVDNVFAEQASTIMESIHNSNLSSFAIRWNRFREYEFLSPSINPANLGH